MSLFLFLFVKASFTFMSQLGLDYPTIHGFCQMHSRLDGYSLFQSFFQPHGLIATWQSSSEWTMEIECPFQRLIHKENHLLLPTLVLLAGWPASTCSYSHSVQKALHLSFPFLHCNQKLLCLPTGWNSSFSVYSCTVQSPCKPRIPSI